MKKKNLPKAYVYRFESMAGATFVMRGTDNTYFVRIYRHYEEGFSLTSAQSEKEAIRLALFFVEIR